MKIPLGELTPEYLLDIKGTEAWLAPLYESFQSSNPDDGSINLLKGDFKLELEAAGTVKISGFLEYEPMVDCGRCDKKIAWPLATNIKTRFYEPTPPEDQAKAHDLSEGEMDAYYIEANQVDVLSVIIDAINDKLPNHLVLKTEDGEHCQICLEKIGDQVYEDPAAADSGPFAALKNLKTPH